uniref:Centrosomal protein 76 n=1 Tax=Molossus molossus TaxID=27622 RepID=A0A7J8HF45_MOLMO|nr:centrosomal protein 76 [Molossus molossus]
MAISFGLRKWSNQSYCRTYGCTESKVSVGVLNIKLEMYPPLNQTLSQEVVSTQLALEHQKTAEKERLFLVYAKQWWREYLQIRPSHNSRLVKIFAQVSSVESILLTPTINCLTPSV